MNHTDTPNAETQAAMQEARGMNSARFDNADQLLAALDAGTCAEMALQHEADQIAIAGTLLVNACHGAAARAGWWVDNATGIDQRVCINSPVNGTQKLLGKALVGQKLCLVHSEVSEGMEGHRKGLMDDKLPHRSMLEVELADAVIRICDLAGAMNLDLGGAIAEKMAFNSIREDHQLVNRSKPGGKSY